MPELVDEKLTAYYDSVKAAAYERGKSLGFTSAQLQFIIETALLMANVVAMTPPTKDGKPITIEPR